MPNAQKEETEGALTLVKPAEPPVPQEEPKAEEFGYHGASLTVLTDEQSKALRAPFGDDEYDLKPTEAGEVFVAQVHVRRRLNEVLGPGRWALLPVPFKGSTLYSRDGDVVCLRARLYVNGNFVAEAIGEQLLASDRMTYASACEAAKSDALTRCAKDLSVGWECWDKRWCDRWRAKHAVLVQVRKKGQDAKFVWRRKDSPAVRGEIVGPLRDVESPPETPGQVLLITKGQESDLWALITEMFPRKTAEASARKILASHGFSSFHEITTDKYPAIVASIKGGA